MKFMHISDLHIGKRIHEVSMLEDQKFILHEIQRMAREEQIDAMLIAGDIYDKSIPPVGAVELFDDFLVQLAQDKIKVLMISGNHDSPERIAFGGRLMEREGVYVSPVFQEENRPIRLQDEEGDVYIYMLPFIKPAHVREIFPELEISDYTQAIEMAIEHMKVDTTQRNVLISHQFVTGATRSESEDISVGGMDNVSGYVYKDFDYVALGHIHGPQRVGRDTMRYCGTPLKYSFSEANHEKSVTMIHMGKKGNVEIETKPLMPLREMHVIKGTFQMMMEPSIYESYRKDSYVQIILTDEEEIVDVMSKLRVVFPNIMRVDYHNTRTKVNQRIEALDQVDRKSPMELFELLYEKQNNAGFKEEQKRYLEQVMEHIWGGEL